MCTTCTYTHSHTHTHYRAATRQNFSIHSVLPVAFSFIQNAKQFKKCVTIFVWPFHTLCLSLSISFSLSTFSSPSLSRSMCSAALPCKLDQKACWLNVLRFCLAAECVAELFCTTLCSVNNSKEQHQLPLAFSLPLSISPSLSHSAVDCEL